MEKIQVTEEMRPEVEWFKQAKQQTPETLSTFVDHVMNDYLHDYGTVCHAIAACAVAAAWAANRAPGAQGGITGFQAGFVMWDFVRHWSYENNKTGMRLLDYDKLLYPQHEKDFDKVIPQEIWEAVQRQAKLELESKEYAHPDVVAHWRGIVAGHVPFGFVVKEGQA